MSTPRPDSPAPTPAPTTAPLARVAVGVGANLGDAPAAVRAALDLLRARGAFEELRASPLYRTRPVGPVVQDAFVNAAFVARTALSPAQVLAELLEVERAFGRTRELRWGPRTLDLDLLLYDQRVLVEPHLTVPHPRLEERGFVLAPLSDLAPDWVLPGSGRRVADAWRAWLDTRQDPGWGERLPEPTAPEAP